MAQGGGHWAIAGGTGTREAVDARETFAEESSQAAGAVVVGIEGLRVLLGENYSQWRYRRSQWTGRSIARGTYSTQETRLTSIYERHMVVLHICTCLTISKSDRVRGVDVLNLTV